MKKLILALGLLLSLAISTGAQTCPTRPAGDNSNACASTAFVHNSATIPPLPTNDIFVGNGGTPVAVPMVGDCALAYSASTGVITCTKTSGVSFGPFATGTNAENLTGNLGIARFNFGTGASVYTAWWGNGTWRSPATTVSCDGVVLVSSGITISAGSHNLTVLGGSFSATNIGNVISIPQIGATVSGIKGTLNTTISAVTDSTHIVLTDPAGTLATAAAQTIVYGPDKTSDLQDAVLQYTIVGIVGQTCITTDTVTVTNTSSIVGNGSASIIVYRQLSGTAVKPALRITASYTALYNFWIDADAGGNISSSTSNGIINAQGAAGVSIDLLNINGNRSAQVKPALGGIIGFFDQSKITRNIVHDIASYPIRGDVAVSHVLVQGNQVYHGPKVADAAGYIAFFSSGSTSAMSDLRIIGNNLDLSDLLITDMSSGIYVFGGDASVHPYRDIVVANNTLAGASGTTQTTAAGIITVYTYNTAVIGNAIESFGECIGGNSQNITYSGNSMHACGTYDLESNTEVNVTITGNMFNGGAVSLYGIFSENCRVCTVTGNIFNGVGGTAAYIATMFQTTNVSGGNVIEDIVFSGNTVLMPTSSTGLGFSVLCTVTATDCINIIVTGNNFRFPSGGTGSAAVYIQRSAGTVNTIMVGPNIITGAVTGIKIDASVTLVCIVNSMNQAGTPVANSGSASSCT